MEAEFEKACSDGRIAGVALLASNRSGSFEYRQTFGARTLDPAAAGLAKTQPEMRLDTLMRIASATKLITCVAAMQCVDRGLLSLDEDVRHYDPDLKDIQLLLGFDESDHPIYTAPTNKITLRRMLSHSAGFCYDPLSSLLVKWRQLRGQEVDPVLPNLVDRYLVPLVSEPGSEWVYSESIDWAGRVVERVSGQSLEEFVQNNIVKAVGIKKMTFFPQSCPDILVDRADMTVRDDTSSKVVHYHEAFWDTDPEDAFGGLGLFTTPEDYFKVLQSLLRNDEKLVSKEMRNEMLSPQLSPESKDSLNAGLKKNPEYETMGMGGCFPPGSERDHSLAGMYLVEELAVGKTPRRPGTIAWMGYPNFAWGIDPTAEICFLFALQLKPSHDGIARALQWLFEADIYEKCLETS